VKRLFTQRTAERVAPYFWTVPVIAAVIYLWAGGWSILAFIVTCYTLAGYLAAIIACTGEAALSRKTDAAFLDRYEGDLDTYDALTDKIAASGPRSKERAALVDELVAHRLAALTHKTLPSR